MSLWHKLALSCGVLAASFSLVQANQITLYGYCGDNPVPEEMYTQAKTWGQEFAQKGDTVFASDNGNGTIHSFTEGYGKSTNHFQGTPEADDITNYINLKRFLFDSGDAFVVSPCGVGGFTCALEALLWKQRGEHNKPVYFLGREYWQPVLTELNKLDATLDYKLIDSATEIEAIDPKTIKVNREDIKTNFDVQGHSYMGLAPFRSSKNPVTMVEEIISSKKSQYAIADLASILHYLIGHICELYTIKLPVIGDEQQTESLQNILQYFQDKGFLSQVHKDVVSFYKSDEEYSAARKKARVPSE